MSYARWGCDGSDVYIYAIEDPRRLWAQYECCECCLIPYWLPNWVVGDGCFRTRTTAGMIFHLRLHRLIGHTVPQSTLDTIRRDALGRVEK